MSTVKIILDEGESIEEAEETLFKALSTKKKASTTETFSDPAMVHLEQMVLKAHSDMYKDMINEIIEVIESEYKEEFEV